MKCDTSYQALFQELKVGSPIMRSCAKLHVTSFFRNLWKNLFWSKLSFFGVTFSISGSFWLNLGFFYVFLHFCTKISFDKTKHQLYYMIYSEQHIYLQYTINMHNSVVVVLNTFEVWHPKFLQLCCYQKCPLVFLIAWSVYLKPL